MPASGAMHFLRSVCDPRVGLYAALTGSRLGAADVMYTGLATHLKASGPDTAAAVVACDPRDLEAALAKCEAGQASKPSVLQPLFSRDDVADAFAMEGSAAKKSLAEVSSTLLLIVCCCDWAMTRLWLVGCSALSLPGDGGSSGPQVAC